MMRSPLPFGPRPTMRSLISRTVLFEVAVMPSLRRRSGMRRRRRPGTHNHSRWIWIPGSRFASAGMTSGERCVPSLPALPLLHAGIERVARGVTDQIDAQDGDREQQARPEDQRWLDQEVLPPLGHDVAP